MDWRLDFNGNVDEWNGTKMVDIPFQLERASKWFRTHLIGDNYGVHIELIRGDLFFKMVLGFLSPVFGLLQLRCNIDWIDYLDNKKHQSIFEYWVSIELIIRSGLPDWRFQGHQSSTGTGGVDTWKLMVEGSAGLPRRQLEHFIKELMAHESLTSGARKSNVKERKKEK